ncbi:GMC family oxidoreductase N-terminal domain-containing protein [Spongiactinospora sp. TRM90649]|uniref:GMC family oxidoreductase n=1 Tax=Spongiactinospora sp. TRM90649 TaxID=3031114 RepID=UPI0023F6BFA2|nr:GMC family oxidoreductase N-terminal domain-containing protein [Spongiactinospora sp. TRM90649]MDF5753530.1 GMC family oxidoreductase N-terminal domain-containing protein [Spongiactinospora sp. TRM90649]
MTEPHAPRDVDVIVVGAGTAGCVVARRLLDAGATVLLVEAGPDGTGNEAIADPARMHELWDTDVDWGYRTVPQPHAHNRRLHLPRGRVVSGSHALNAMIWVRGHRADYDTWAYLGNPRWSWADVEPVFRRVEAEHGGPLSVLRDYEPDPVQRSIVDAAVQAGVPFDEDYNDGSPDGVSFMRFTIRDGRRLTTADAYLGPVRDHARLHVLTGAHVRRLLFDGTRCTGIEYEADGRAGRVHAGQHVVVAAGAIGSPVLLQRSGVGDPRTLRPLGVDMVAALPGVGGNLQDHWLVPVIFGTGRAPGRPHGLPTTQSHLFARSRAGLPVPDLQPLHFGAPLYADWMSGPAEGFSLMAGLVRPAASGRVAITSADPGVAPMIDPRVLSSRADLDGLAAAVELCREIGAQPALRAGWGAAELYPGTLGATRELLDDYIRESVVTYHHQAGTCAMGGHEDAVVDEELAVHGVEALSVADASVMPAVTTGNTNAPTAMIAERAAEFLIKRL